jgi:gas vesicle protein
MAALPGGLPASTGPAKDPAWAIAAFGEPEPSKEEQAKEKAAEESEELTEKQTKALDELKAKQQKELSDFLKKQQEERAHLIKREAEALKQARANTAKEAPSTAPPPKK